MLTKRENRPGVDAIVIERVDCGSVLLWLTYCEACVRWPRTETEDWRGVPWLPQADEADAIATANNHIERAHDAREAIVVSLTDFTGGPKP